MDVRVATYTLDGSVESLAVAESGIKALLDDGWTLVTASISDRPASPVLVAVLTKPEN